MEARMMKINIEGVKEKNVIQIKALSMSKSTLDQLRELKQQDITGAMLERLSPWIGYVIEPVKGSSITTTWMLALLDDSTLIKVRETEFFWILRYVMQDADVLCDSDAVHKELRNILDGLPQIFI